MDGGAGDESHVAQDGEDQHARQQAGQRVHYARDDRVPDEEKNYPDMLAKNLSSQKDSCYLGEISTVQAASNTARV